MTWALFGNRPKIVFTKYIFFYEFFFIFLNYFNVLISKKKFKIKNTLKNKYYQNPKQLLIKAIFVCWKVIFFWKVNSRKVNYFSMFGSVMKNKLENNFQCLVMSWKMSWKITY